MLTHLIDFPSLIIVSSAVIAGLIVGQVNPKRGSKIAKDTCISVGVIGIVIGYVKMLAMMDDPDALAPAVAVALLTPLYGLLMYPLLHAASNVVQNGSKPSAEVTGQTAILASAVVVVFCVAGMLYGGGVITIFVDPVAFLCFGMGVLLPALLSSRRSEPQERWLAMFRNVPRYSSITTIAGMILCFVGVLHGFDDPAVFGPSIAVGFLTSLYCGFALAVSSIAYTALTDAEQPTPFLHATLYFFANFFLVGFTTAVMFSMIS